MYSSFMKSWEFVINALQIWKNLITFPIYRPISVFCLIMRLFYVNQQQIAQNFCIEQGNMEDINLTLSFFVNQSRLYNKQTQQSRLEDPLEDIFLHNANKSYLAQMSEGKKPYQLSEIHNQTILGKKKSKRINFQDFQGINTSDIYHYDSLKGDWQLFQIVALKQEGEKQYKEESKSALFCCEGTNIPLICKAKLQDTHFQLLRSNISKPLSKLQLFFGLNFDTVTTSVYYQQHLGSSQLILKTQKVTIVLKPLQKNGGRYWFKQLQNSIAKSKGKHNSLTALDSINQYYKKRFETEAYFTANCKNGDILLFQDNHFMAKMQRLVTRSEFDHVGIVLRDKKHGLLIFESNSGSGVCLTPWKYVIMFQWYKTIPRITWRRLQLERTSEFDTKLQEFVVKSLPLQFHFSIAKLTAQQSFIVVDEHNNDEAALDKNQSNGYFCSELVAKAYKHLGLLVGDKENPSYLPSSRFYPKDFSVCAQLQLEKGHLGQERDIVFDTQLLKEDYAMGN